MCIVYLSSASETKQRRITKNLELKAVLCYFRAGRLFYW